MRTMHPALARLRTLPHSLFGRRVPARPKLAVFIDGDGVSPKDAEKVLAELPVMGRVCILRCYGNYTGRAAQGWTKLIRKHGAVARHMPSIIPGKNAADIALAIDAVELLWTRNIDTFVLIASDSDFTPLARRLGEAGKGVVGYGSRQTPEPFRSACTAFHETASLTPPVTPKAPLAPLWSLSPADAEDIILAVLSDITKNDAPVSLQELGEQLARREPGFDCRIYSRRTLSDLVRDLSSVTLVHQNGKRFAQRVRARD